MCATRSKLDLWWLWSKDFVLTPRLPIHVSLPTWPNLDVRWCIWKLPKTSILLTGMFVKTLEKVSLNVNKFWGTKQTFLMTSHPKETNNISSTSVWPQFWCWQSNPNVSYIATAVKIIEWGWRKGKQRTFHSVITNGIGKWKPSKVRKPREKIRVVNSQI